MDKTVGTVGSMEPQNGQVYGVSRCGTITESDATTPIAPLQIADQMFNISVHDESLGPMARASIMPGSEMFFS